MEFRKFKNHNGSKTFGAQVYFNSNGWGITVDFWVWSFYVMGDR